MFSVKLKICVNPENIPSTSPTEGFWLNPLTPPKLLLENQVLFRVNTFPPGEINR